VVIVYLLLHLAAVSQGVGIASWYYHAAFWAAILAYASFQIGDYLVQQHSEEDLQLMVRRPAAERQIRKVQNPNPTPTTRTQGEDETTEQWMERMTKQHEEKKRK
jgi:alpha/beta superfamily hydrolase